MRSNTNNNNTNKPASEDNRVDEADEILLAQATQDQKKKRAKPDRITLKPHHLMNPEKGLKFLYNEFDKLNLYNNNSSDQFDEVKLLSKFTKFIKIWHHNLMPRYELNYFLEKSQQFGQKPEIRSYLDKMRKAHKRQIKWEDLDYNEDNNLNINQNSENDEDEQHFGRSQHQQSQESPKKQKLNKTQNFDRVVQELQNSPSIVSQQQQQQFNIQNESNEDEDEALEREIDKLINQNQSKKISKSKKLSNKSKLKFSKQNFTKESSEEEEAEEEQQMQVETREEYEEQISEDDESFEQIQENYEKLVEAEQEAKNDFFKQIDKINNQLFRDSDDEKDDQSDNYRIKRIKHSIGD